MTTAPSVLVSDALFALYLQLRPGSTKADFYVFLTSPSADRDVFLSTHCASSFSQINNIVIHKLR